MLGRAAASLTLHQRVFIGFGCMLFIIVLVVVINLATTYRMGNIFLEYRATARQTLALNADLEDLLEARTAALRFRSDPTPNTAESVFRHLDDMAGRSLSSSLFAEATPAYRRLESSDANMRSYRAAFDETVFLQHELETHVEDLVALGPSIRGDLVHILSRARSDGDLESAYQVALAMQAMLLGRLYTERYLLRHRHKDIRRALLEFDDMKATLTLIESQTVNGEILSWASLAKEKTDQFIAIVDKVRESVATRDRLHIETLDLLGPQIEEEIDTLLESIVARQNSLGPQGTESILNARRWSLVVAVLALIGGVVMSQLFSRRLSSQIGSMATTMSAIANGQLTVEVEPDYLRRSDALGQMARALAVFRDNAETARDVGLMKQQQAKLEEYARSLETEKHRVEKAANCDALTGLANRRRFDDQIITCALSLDLHKPISLIHVDLDKFKHINDTLGHAAGDHVLIHTAKVLRQIAGEEAFIARIGGDEFVILLDGIHQDEDADRIASTIIATLSQPIMFEGRPCRFGASIGIACLPAHSVVDLTIHADIALYEAKNKGRGQVQRFNDELKAAMIGTKQIADDLEQALSDGQIIPFFQPQFDAETGAFVGLEALARWEHPERGFIEPGRFMCAAEEFGLVCEIDRRILSMSLDMCSDLASEGIVVPKLSINVTCDRMADPHLLAEIDRKDPDGPILAFELLETIFLDQEYDRIESNIKAVRAKGIQIEIDDFGTGRASIIALQKVSPDRLKIDRQLVFPIVGSEGQRRLVASIIDIGRALSIDVTAEGVESEEHARILRLQGCRTLQGYHFSHPLSRDALVPFVKSVYSVNENASNITKLIVPGRQMGA